jgi:ActR/RegA family two-component response regulator
MKTAFVSLARRRPEPASDEESTWMNPAFVFPESGFSLEEATNLFVERALAQSDGNVSAAARLLGVTRDFVRYRVKSRPAGD